MFSETKKHVIFIILVVLIGLGILFWLFTYSWPSNNDSILFGDILDKFHENNYLIINEYELVENKSPYSYYYAMAYRISEDDNIAETISFMYTETRTSRDANKYFESIINKYKNDHPDYTIERDNSDEYLAFFEADELNYKIYAYKRNTVVVQMTLYYPKNTNYDNLAIELFEDAVKSDARTKLTYIKTANGYQLYGIYEITSEYIYIPQYHKGLPVTSIGCDAFHGCTSLTSVTIPDSVTSIGNSAFFNCASLTSITIPNSVTSIGDGAFSCCHSLTSVTIPNSVTSIGNYAFEYCPSLTSVTIPDSVTAIGNEAFYGCSSLTSVTIGKSVTSIGGYAFRGCASLTNISVDENNEYYKSIDGNLYTKDGKTLIQYAIGKKDTSFTIPDSVTSIGEFAFDYCESLTSVTIPDSVTSIGEYAFCDCTLLESVTIPDSVTSIGRSTFFGCTSLTSVTIPDSVTAIGNEAFHGCSSLTSVTIPNSVTYIGDDTFYGCTSLTNISVDENNENYKSIDGNLYTKDGKTLVQYAIGKKNTSFTIPDSVTSIGKHAFSGCTSLTSVTIPNSVTSIGEYAFAWCTSLTSIAIPDSVTSIDDNAFAGCTSLSEIHYNGTKADWNGIDKGRNWDSYIGSYTVHCTDGDISK